MNLQFNIIKNDFTSQSQNIRVITENWVCENMFCPRCGYNKLNHFENNRPVADFYCNKCNNQYELKSKKNSFGTKIPDGAYDTMIERITSDTNPDFLFLSYLPNEQKVNNLLLIPKHFFTPDIIEKRNPLNDTARRAGWVGCNILINQIPKQGIVPIIDNTKEIDKEKVVNNTNKSFGLVKKNLKSRGWLIDILNCVNKIKTDYFNINDMYLFENELYLKYPNNDNIRAKIRQQLQFLRDKGYIEFIGRGQYKKIY